MHLETSNFVPKSRFRIFRHGQSIALSTKLLVVVVVDSSTVELVDDTYTTIDESWLFITSGSSVTL